MQSILAKHAEGTGVRVHCINYTDTNSVDGKSYEDMVLGRTQKMVGCNNLNLRKAAPGDIVIVTAKKSGVRVAHIGILKGKSDTCLLWAAHGSGGRMWEFNWEYDPCTADLSVTRVVKTFAEWGLPRQDAFKLFNGWFCSNHSELLLPYIARAFRDGVFPVCVKP